MKTKKRTHWWIIVTRDCQFPCGAFPFMTRKKARDRKREFNSTIYKVIKIVEAGTEIEYEYVSYDPNCCE